MEGKNEELKEGMQKGGGGKNFYSEFGQFSKVFLFSLEGM